MLKNLVSYTLRSSSCTILIPVLLLSPLPIMLTVSFSFKAQLISCLYKKILLFSLICLFFELVFRPFGNFGFAPPIDL